MLEEVDQQSSVNISFCQCLSWSSSITFLVSNSEVIVLKIFYGLYIHVIRPHQGLRQLNVSAGNTFLRSLGIFSQKLKLFLFLKNDMDVTTHLTL